MKSPSLTELWEAEWPQSQEEFEAFVEVFQERLYRFLYYRLRNLHDAEDVMQSIFLKAYNERNKLQKVKNQAGSYLFRMAMNACIDRHRKKKREPPISELDSTNELQIGLPAEAMEQAEIGRIQDILQQIPAKQAEVIRLRIMDELSFSEIAKVLGCFETTVRTRYRYGIRKLRQIIQKEENP